MQVYVSLSFTLIGPPIITSVSNIAVSGIVSLSSSITS